MEREQKGEICVKKWEILKNEEEWEKIERLK